MYVFSYSTYSERKINFFLELGCNRRWYYLLKVVRFRLYCIQFWDKRCQFIRPIRQTLQAVRSQPIKTPNSWLGFDFGLELSLVVSQPQAIYRVSWFFSLLIMEAQIAFENSWVLVFSASFLLVFIAVLMQIIMCKKIVHYKYILSHTVAQELAQM